MDTLKIFLGLVVVLTVGTFVGYFMLLHAMANKGFTLAIFKRCMIWGVGILGTVWIICVSFPRAYGIGDYLIPIILFFAVPLGLVLGLFYLFEEITESAWYRKHFSQGKGASSRWAGEATFRANEMPGNWSELQESDKRGSLLMGRTWSRWDSSPRSVGITDEVHMFTIGTSGAGKSWYVLYNNLCAWPGSCIVLDPKGELAAKTIESRQARVKGKQRILCPFEVPELAGIHDRLKCRFNPLAEIDLADQTALTSLRAIADACYITSAKADKFWRQGAMSIMVGLFAHILSRAPKEKRTLPFIADQLLKGEEYLKKIMKDMAQNPVLGGAAIQAATTILEQGDRAYGILRAELSNSFQWITDPAMREHLSGSDFSLKDLYNEPGTGVFLVLPVKQMKEDFQARWMRVVMRLAMNTVQDAPKPPDPRVLIVFDEFPALGKFQSVLDDFRTLRGAGMKLWILTQDVSSLLSDRMYGTEFNSFAGSANVQVIGLGNCKITHAWVSELIGNYITKGENGNPLKVSLMDPTEVSNFLDPDGKNQIVKPVSGFPWQVESIDWGKSSHAYRKR